VTSGQGTATESGGRWPWTPSRCGNGPQVMATLRNLAIAIFKLAGTTNIAAACRSHARDATRVLAALGLSAP
jgi:hypothetical protein